MKVTLINHSDTQGGAAIVTFRLMEALRQKGVDARMLVVKKNSTSPYVEPVSSSLVARIPFLAEHLRIFLQNGLSRKRLFQVSTASDGLPLSKHPLVQNADAIILNWINQGMLSLKEIKKIAETKPTVWTMHDQWNFTGICHHTDGCDRFTSHCHDCHFLGRCASVHDLSYRYFQHKAELNENVDITYVALSNWIATRAANSAILRNKKIEIIPNAFPVETFARPNRISNSFPMLPTDRKLILFCAARVDDPGKGLDDAIDALNRLSEPHASGIMAVFAGQYRNRHLFERLKIPYILLGPVSGSRIPELMSRASVVLSSSPFETFSTTMIEAQAAGTTPVCYTHDGRGDIVVDNVNGYSLSNDADAITKALDKPIDRKILLDAAARYRADKVADAYISLLERVIARRAGL